MDKQRQKSMQESVKAIFKKAEDREKAGGDQFVAGWQAVLELMLLVMEKHLLENPGQLLPMQISKDDEWEFYLDVMEKIDLPPDTGAVLVTPGAFKEMSLFETMEFEDSKLARWNRNAYSIILSNLSDRTLILQASLPGIEFAGIDIFKDGKHLADYMYNTVEECLEELSEVIWLFFKPKGEWSKDQIIQYTENWHGKTVYGVEGPDVKYHTDFSYLHHPELIDMTPLDAVFKLVQATVPKEIDSLEKAIEITNEINQEMDSGDPIITEEGILADDRAHCQALLDRISVEIDMKLDMLSYLKDEKVFDRNIKYPNYRQIFDKTAKRIYEAITGRDCPEPVKVIWSRPG
ncbi:MAG: hypothetical protein JXA35_07705 [Deltaproteobacteria bacterium]|nr:hypothetical protein [Deltaproteobacteria bacterium]